MNHPSKIRKSQATSPGANTYPDGAYLTLDQFKLIIIGFALQNRVDDPEYEGMDLGDHLRWMLSYWRADHEDDSRFDKAEIYMYGRIGYCEVHSDEEILDTLLSATSPDATDSEVPYWDASGFIDWAFNKYVNWAPEPVRFHRTQAAFQILSVQTAVLFAQFVDHFEQCEIEHLMMWLLQNYGANHDVWNLLDNPDKNIEVEISENSDRTIHLTTPSGSWLRILWSDSRDLTATWHIQE